MAADANITMALDPRTSGGGLFSKGDPHLPPDLARQAVARVKIAAWVFAAIWALVILMNDFVFAGEAGAPGITWGTRQTTLTVIGLMSSVGLAWLSTRLRERPEALFEVALAFQVLTALLVSLVTEYYPRTEPQALSWVCVVILTLPTIAPASPRKTLAASLIAASTVPLALFYTRYSNPTYDPPLSVIVWLALPPFICAVLAMIPAAVIRGLGKQVKRAREVGSYELGEKIGSGGMGEVYRATHRLLARPAAVKLISQSVLNANTGANHIATVRFRREADAAASLSSPHTIQLYDYGVAEDGSFYYVMELLDGIDLHELVTRYGAQPPERVSYLIAQTCDSLGEAHSKGLVHRDIKPSNILACRMGLQVDYVKVLDFGLVKTVRGRDHEAETHLTGAGSVSGTPAFMAPECISGMHSVEASSDVYALGCVAYWLLTGDNVFKAANATMMMMQHMQNSPVPPSHKSPAPVPRALEELVLRCLSKDPSQRPADACALAACLAAAHLPALWTATRAEQWWKENRPLA